MAQATAAVMEITMSSKSAEAERVKLATAGLRAEAAKLVRAAEKGRETAEKAAAEADARLNAGLAQATSTILEMAASAERSQSEKVELATAALTAQLKTVSLKASKAKEEFAKGLKALEDRHLASAAKLSAFGIEELRHAREDQLKEEEDLLRAHTAEIDELKTAQQVELTAIEKICDDLRGAKSSVLGLCEALLPTEQLDAVRRMPYVAGLSACKGNVEDMHVKQQSVVGKVTGLLLDAVLRKMSEADPEGALKAMLSRRDGPKTLVGGLVSDSKAKAKAVCNPVFDGVVAAYKAAMRSGDTMLARQQLSLLVMSPGITDADIIEACSERSPLTVGDDVHVIGLGSKTVSAKIIAVVNADIVEVTGLGNVSAGRVCKVGEVRCSKHQVHAAKVHAKSKYPGAPVSATVKRHVGIEQPRAEFVTRFLRDPTVVSEVEASLANARKGVQYRLKAVRWQLWHRLVNEMEAAALKPVSWGYFWLLTSTKQYELLTVDNCCCGICRELGFENFEEMCDIVGSLDAALLLLSNDASGLPLKQKLLDRIRKVEEFMRGLFITHLKPESNCAAHCLTHNLSSRVDSRFRKHCSHGANQKSSGAAHGAAEAGGTGADDTGLKTWEQRVRETCGRRPRSSDWNDTCEVCNGTQTGNVLMCTHCNVVAHPTCIKRTHWDLPHGKEDKWMCWDCAREADALQHPENCEECNELGYIVDDVKRGIDLLASFELASGASGVSSETGRTSSGAARGGGAEANVSPPTFRAASASELLGARLRIAEGKMEQYRAHLMRDRNQGCFKDLALETLPLTSFYLLIDYWAKIPIGKRGGTATCEGNSIGLSAHGSMFVYRNPTIAQRRWIDETFVPIYWSLFGPASDEEGGLAYLEEHFNVYCDDAKQNNYHTKSVLDASIATFLEGRPWLRGSREARVQSDNASNYRDPTTEVDLDCVGTRIFSVAGMGKNEGDSNGAVNKSRMSRMRDEGWGIESATGLCAMGNTMGISGQTHAKLHLKRSNEDSGIAGRDSVCRNYALWTIDDKFITMYESLDVSASKTSMLDGGRAVGFGPGVKIPLVEFKKTQLTQIKPTEATLEFADGSSSSLPHPRQRASRSEKSAIKAEAEEKKAAAKIAAVAKNAGEQAVVEESFAGDVNQCPRCGLQFLTDGWFHRHNQKWCPSRDAQHAQRVSDRDVAAKLRAVDILAVDARAVRIAGLNKVKVVLRAPKDGTAEVGITLKQDESGDFIIDAVSALAAASAQIGCGNVLMSIGEEANSVAVGDASTVPRVLQPGQALVLTIMRAQPPIPYHGQARQGIHMNTKFTMHEEQLKWLEANVFEDGLAKMRPADAWIAMKAHFSGKIRVSTMTPMWLEKDQIGEWLAGKKATEKVRRKQAKTAGAAKAKPASRKARGASAKKQQAEADATVTSSGESSSSSAEESPSDYTDEEASPDC